MPFLCRSISGWGVRDRSMCSDLHRAPDSCAALSYRWNGVFCGHWVLVFWWYLKEGIWPSLSLTNPKHICSTKPHSNQPPHSNPTPLKQTTTRNAPPSRRRSCSRKSNTTFIRQNFPCSPPHSIVNHPLQHA